MEEIIETSNIEFTTQFILDENKELVEISRDICKKVEFQIKVRLSSAFEVFVRVHGTENYWISNYGRCVNNLKSKNKDIFYEHKKGKCHYSVFEVDKYIEKMPFKTYKNGKIKYDESKRRSVKTLSLDLTEDECNDILLDMQSADEKRKYFIRTSRFRNETSPEQLVAEHFLANRSGDKIWHKDGDEENNWYKNLIRVTRTEYRNLQNGKISYKDLKPSQEYIEYENRATAIAYSVYNGIKNRSRDTTNVNYIGKCYDDVTMCDEWRNNPESFVKWYFEHYYEIDGEAMAIDKDLFSTTQKIYSPDTCCFLPRALNNLIVNCKKAYFEGETKNDVLPLGVRKVRDGYCGIITLNGTNDEIILSRWDTPEEAFAEYKIMKQADIKLVAARYKNKVPDYIYNKLLTVEVEPY